MAEYEKSQSVSGRAADIYDYLADPAHLTEYVATMVQAQVVSRGHLHVAADVSRGHEEGEAMFRSDSAARRIEWGGREGHAYSGWLAVAEGGSATESVVTIHLSTSDDENAAEIERAISETLGNIASMMSPA
jgi:hypothetical protein